MKVSPLDRHIAARVMVLRHERGITQPGVAGVLGVSYQSYQKMERGAVSFRASTLQKLASLFEVPVAHFFTKAPPPKVPNGPEIASIISIVRRMDHNDAKSIVEHAVKVKGG